MIQTLNTRVRRVISSLDEHTLEVISKSSSSLLVKLLGLSAGMVVSIALGRTLGAAGLGIVNLTQLVATVLMAAAMLGMDTVLIKRVAIGHESGKPQEVASSLYTASVINGLLAGVFTVAGMLAAPWLSRRVFHTQALEIPLVVTLAMLVPQAFARIYAASLNGFRKIWQSNLANNTMSTWVVGVGLAMLYVLHLPITVISVAVLYAVGRLAVYFSLGIYHRTLFHYSGPRNFIPRPMLAMGIPLLITTTAFQITSNADGVMLGWLRSPHEVGLYSVAGRLTIMESLFLMVSNSAIGPKLAFLYSCGRLREVERMIHRVTAGLTLLATISLMLFVVFGHWLLSIWGREFGGAYLVLVVLGIGQFFNISTGCCGMLLVMCGHEKILGYLSSAFLVINLILNYFLILKWGALGAASATAITIAGQNIAKLIIAKRKTGISTVPF